MNTLDTNDRLKNMFCEIKMENTSDDFMKGLMLRVEKEAVVEAKKKKALIYLSIFSGVAGIILIPFLIFYYLEISIQMSEVRLPNVFLEISSLFSNFKIDPNILGLGLIILILLLVDLIFRKYLDKNKNLA